jgi:hypothetical protein
VSVTTSGGFTNALAVDDVEFSTAGPPPPCVATSMLRITLNRPTDGTIVQTDAFILEGSVDAGGAPITSASVIAQGTTTRNGPAHPTPIDSFDGSG